MSSISPATLALWRVRHRCRRAWHFAGRSSACLLSAAFFLVALPFALAAAMLGAVAMLFAFLTWVSWPAPRS